MSNKQKGTRLPDLNKQVKEAAVSGGVGTLGGSLLGLVGASAVTGGLGYLLAKNQYERHTTNLKSSFDSLTASDAYLKNPDEFRNRFAELSLISPTVASNPILANKVIAPRISSGFDLDDIHRLSAVEYHTSNTVRVSDPVHTGLTRASDNFSQGLQSIAPALAMHMFTPKQRPQKTVIVNAGSGKTVRVAEKDVGRVARQMQDEKMRRFEKSWEGKATPEEIEAMKADLRRMAREKAEGKMDKTSSVVEAAVLSGHRVSDECLGRMIADRYTMYKSAAATSSFSKMLKPFGKGVDAIKNHFQLIGPALVLGGGIQLLREAMKSRDNHRLREQADGVFAKIRRDSDYIKQNPEIAQEAFDTLKTFAPSVAVKPLVAKSFVEGVVKAEHMGVDTASMLAQTEGRIRENSGDLGFLEGLKTPMSIFSMSVGKKKD